MKRSDYLEILKPVMNEYQKFSYSFWSNNINSKIYFEGESPFGAYQVEIEAYWLSDPDGDIEVSFSIDNGGWRACFPVTQIMSLTKTPE